MKFFNKKKRFLWKNDNFISKNYLFTNINSIIDDKKHLDLMNKNINLPNNNITNIQKIQSLQSLKIFKFKNYNDTPIASEVLLKNGQVIINLELLNKNDRIRILDFFSGIIYVFKGYIQKLENKLYYFIINS